MVRFVVIIFLLSFLNQSYAQERELNGTATVGDSEGSLSILFGYDWELGKKKKFAIGIGARATSYFGSNQYYVTAPAELTSGSTGPGVIFKENIEENMDTFLIKSPQVNEINVFINLLYKIS
jgi:hypothetical protein